MDITKTSLLFIISISSLFLLTNAVPSTRNIHIVDHDLRSDLSEFCKKTTNPIICARTIKPFFLHKALDPLKALEVEVDATWNQTEKTVGVIDTLLAKKDITKSLKSSLGTCKDQYKSILDSIKETKDAIAKNDVITAKFKFSAVLSFQASCMDQFVGEKEKIPFSEDSDIVYQLGGNCLDIIADLEKAAGPQEVIPKESAPSAFSDVIGTVS